MKIILTGIIAVFGLVFLGCAHAQDGAKNSSLEVAAFDQKLKATSGAVVLDVRTPQEFEKGHLQGAVNFNWNDDAFQNKVSKMDKKSPVFVYCLSGGRSNAAAQSLLKQGFEEVYEMKGGIMKWRAANLPLVTASPTATASGMSLADFETAIGSGKTVLVDFYAEWCGPCRKMEPYLKEIAKEKAGKVTLLRIDIDANPDLAKALKIEALPVLHVYKNKRIAWSNTGYITKDKVLKQL